MKKNLLLKLLCLSVFTMWANIGISQVKEIITNVSIEPEKAKALINAKSVTGKPAEVISPDLIQDKQSTKSVSLSEKDEVLSNSRLIPVAPDISIKETLQSSIGETISKIDNHKIDTVIIKGTSGKVSDLENIPVPPVISTPDITVITNVAENLRNDQNIVLAPGMNLTPYQPTGWDNKIVLSTVTGTNTSAATIYDNQTIYLDWAAINNGVVNITSTFYSRLYVDGVLTGYYSTPGLNSNYYTTLTDEIIGPLSAGTHSFRIVVDSDANVTESNETDNEYTRTFTITASPVCANLTPYQPSGWDNKIVLSTVTGTTTSASTIYDNQTIYLDWAVINNGTCNIIQTFYFKLYVDGVLTGYYSTLGLNSNYYTFVSDEVIGPLAAGSHTFRIVADSDGNVPETNESDNEYTRTFTITASVCANLTPYQPAGWDNKIVLSTVTGTTTSASVIYDNQPIYLDWAEINNGTCNISQTFYTKLYIDGVLTANYITNGLASNSYAFISDAAIGTLSAGSHTFRIVADSDGNVPETNESDNEYTRTFTITASVCANLTPYQPAGWDNKIVLSTVTGTTTSASVIYDNQPIYLDWAEINNGTCNISQTFYTKLYIDGVLTANYITNGLASNSYAFISDAAIGTLSAGSHTFRIVADSDGNVPETNESDNEYTRTFTITASVCVNLTPYQPSGWDNKIVLSTVTGTTTSASAIYDNQTIYLDWAAINNGTCNISQTFYTKLFVDGVLNATYTTYGLSSNYYASISDAVIGPLSAGSHTFRILVDSEGNVPETNESDNEYIRTISILQQVVPDIVVAPTSLTINQTGASSRGENPLASNPNVPVYVPKIPDSLIVSTFVDINGDNVDIIKVPGTPPPFYREKIAYATNAAVTLTVPAFDWSFGCSATSASMIAGYYDNNGYPNMYTGPTNGGVMPMTNASWGSVIINGETRSQCPLSATRNGVDGRTIRGHVDDYWVVSNSTEQDPYITNGWTQHTYGDCTGDFMKTNQSAFGNSDASTSFYFNTNGSPYTGTATNDGGYGFELFLESRGYTVTNRYNQYILGYNGNTIGFTFNQYMAEIDAGRPVLIQVNSHTMVGYGYDLTGNIVYLHDTWDYSNHSMTWGGSYSGLTQYGVSVFQLAPNSANNSFLISNVGTGILNIASITSNKNWLTASGYPATPFSISPSGSQNVSVAVNWALVGSSTQIGTITIASNDPVEPSVTVQVTAIPLSCSLSVSPSNQNVPYSPAGSATFSVTSNCAWTAVSNQTWCTVTPSGTGNGTITASYSANTSGSARVANITVTVAGLTPTVVTVTQLASTHFYPVWWPGSGLDHMNLYALTATLDNVALQPGDEIGIFDGNVCVGMGVLTQVLNGTVFLSMVASKDDAVPPAKNGYTPGNTITYKVWDSSAGIEVSPAVASYTVGSGIFAVGATAAFNLSAQSPTTQSLSLTAGWNIMSFAVQPTNMSMLSIVNPLITAATLTKVQDERGNAIEQLPAPIGWVDNIGLMKIEEGYKIKVTVNTTLSVTGQPVTLPYTLALSTGWNIMGYPSMNSRAALPAFNPLITAATLLKVQDEAGNAIEQLPAPIGWIDNIINLTPGHGYKVKTTANTTLTISSPGKGEYQNAEGTIITRPTHFKLAYTGNGLDQMNIYIKKPTVGGVAIKTGDEIGVFDGNLCVGAVVVNDPNQEYYMVVASLDDPGTKEADGFKEGNNLELRLWDNQAGLERKAQQMEIDKGYNKTFEKLGTSVLAVDFETVIYTSLGDAFPNPSTDKTTFTFQLGKESKVRLEIFNMEGDLIKVLVDRNMAGGTHQTEWDNRSGEGTRARSGVYFYRLKLNNFMQTKQLVIH